MRKCIRCDVKMIEDYDVKVEGGAYGLKITKPGIFKDKLGKVHASVCPECGYLEFYLEDTAKIKNRQLQVCRNNREVTYKTINMKVKNKRVRSSVNRSMGIYSY